MKPVAVLFVGLLSLVCNGIYATIKLGVSDGRAFPVPLGAAVFDVDRSVSFVALSEATGGEDGQYAVSMVNVSQDFYQGVTPAKMRIGSVYDQDNPLFGKKISKLALVEHAPVVVSDDQPNSVYAIRNPGTSGTFLIASPVFKLDNGLDCSRIENIVGFPAQGAFFAVLRGAQPFGADDSTITVATVGLDEAKKTIVIKQSDTALVHKASEALKINEDLQDIEPAVAQGVSEHFQTCYTGLRVISADEVDAGARAVFLGLDIPIAPDDAIEADSIIGTNERDTAVRIYHVATMWTTTGFDYLVVVGGKEPNPGDKKASVSALPLVGYGEGFGRLAKWDSKIETLVNVYNKKQVVGRAFSEAALAAGDIPAANDDSVVVGGNAVLPGDVLQLLVAKDTVFVAVADDDEVHGGMFSSTALFDKDGRIRGWTNWAPAGGIGTKAVAGFLDQANAVWYSMRGETWDDVVTVERTQWQESNWGAKLDEFFGQDEHGVQCVVDFPRTHSAFSQDDDNRTSLICLTGNGKVALAQSGFTDPNDDCFRVLGAIGTVEKNSTARVADAYLWDGQVLADIGAIITADIVSYGGNSWLVVGGSHGAAVLCRPDGTGWVTGALGSNFDELPQDLMWKKFYSGRAVRKICANGDTFFLLTEESLHRFTPTPGLFLGGGLGPLLADSTSFRPQYPTVRFSDLFVSNELALLATDVGLWRSGNGKDVRDASSLTVGWQLVELPESMYSVTRLYPISPTGISQDILGDERGGNVLALSSSVGRNGSSVYRLALQPVLGGDEVSNETVALLPDCFTVIWSRNEITEEPKRTYFVSRGDYRNYVATDGALWLFSRNAYAPTNAPAFVEALPAAYRSMSTQGPSMSRVVWAAHKGAGMGPLCLRSSDGGWLAGGSRIYGQN